MSVQLCTVTLDDDGQARIHLPAAPDGDPDSALDVAVDEDAFATIIKALPVDARRRIGQLARRHADEVSDAHDDLRAQADALGRSSDAAAGLAAAVDAAESAAGR